MIFFHLCQLSYTTLEIISASREFLPLNASKQTPICVLCRKLHLTHNPVRVDQAQAQNPVHIQFHCTSLFQEGCWNLPSYKPLCLGFSWLTVTSDFTQLPIYSCTISTLIKNNNTEQVWRVNMDSKIRRLLIQMQRKRFHRSLWLKLGYD